MISDAKIHYGDRIPVKKSFYEKSNPETYAGAS
jgi:hypothetical protein